MRERPVEPSAVERTVTGAEPHAATPYSPPRMTPLGTLAELTAGSFGGSGADISVYQS
jgi:hypothetical protein